MDRYYYYLSKGDPTDIALQRSKIDFLTYGDPVKAHPYYWAGYVNVGNPFEFPVKRDLIYLWIILSVVAIGAGFYLYRLRSKHS
jgi:hypothetical protein